MDGMETSFFDQPLSFKLGNTATRMSQALAVLQQYLSAMGLFSYVANDKM